MAAPIIVKKSYKDGCVSVRVTLKAGGYGHLKAEGDADLKSDEARALAKSLIEEADKADAKVAAKAVSAERRRKYRDREIAAGRMRVMTF